MPDQRQFVGIDVAMRKLDVHVDPTGEAFTVPNTEAGIRQVVARLEPDALIALEASGGYERTALEGMDRSGFSVFRLHPADVRAFARLQGRRAKTDRIDAALIAQAARVAATSRKPCHVSPAATDIKEMATSRRLLQNQLTALKGQITRLATEAMKGVIAQQIEQLEAAIRQIGTMMNEGISRDPHMRDMARRIQTAPGAGPVLAATLVAWMPELGQLSSRQAASLTGVAPHPRQSGTSDARGRCQGGRTQVRTVLYMATLAAIRTRASDLGAFFKRLMANGKPFKLAMVATMRKFIVMLNAMIRNGQDWKPQPN